jgi:hypothetical protein
MDRRTDPAASSGKPGLIERIRGEDSYALVLGMTVLTIVFLAGSSDTGWQWTVGIALLCGTLLIALHTSKVRPRTFNLAVLLCVFAVAGAAASSTSEARIANAAIPVIGALLVAVTPVAMLRRVVAHPRINAQTVFAVVSVYLLVGLFFAFAYMVDGQLAEAPFFEANGTSPASDGTTGDYLFFSYVTLTTVGYGNLVPGASVGRLLAMLEALLGQIYLVTVVAMIVAGFAAGARERREARHPGSPVDGGSA